MVLDFGNDLGQWRLSHGGQCIIAGSGIVGMEGKEATEDFSTKLEELKGLLENNPKASKYKMTKLAPITLAKALNEDWNKLGELEELTKIIHIGDETKRCYPKRPRTGQDILTKQYDSTPWDIAMVSHK